MSASATGKAPLSSSPPKPVAEDSTMGASPTEILERLLTDDAFRAAVREGRVALPPEFATIDPEQLQKTAEQLRRDLIYKQFRGSGGLLERFGRTLGPALSGADDRTAASQLDAIFARFVASDAYRLYREWPRTGEGTCLEEAFFRFAEAEGLGDPAAREQDFFEAVIRAILLSPDPGFAIPAEVTIPAAGVAFAITKRGAAPFLVAATHRGLVQGPITPLIAALITGESPDAVAATHDVPVALAHEALSRLRGLGIVGEAPPRES